MLTTHHFLVSCLVLLSATAYGFGVFPAVRPYPSLQKHAEAQKDALLQVSLVVGRKEEQRLPIDGLILELNTEDALYKHPSLPGANGPNRQISTGARSLRVVEDPYFVDMTGKQRVKLENGCWEMVWRDQNPVGSIVCGFDLLEEAKRNDASLPKGRIYMTFPLWTKDGLKEYQVKRDERAELGKQYIKQKDDELTKMQETNNPLMKALHYRNAAAAVEKYQMSGSHFMTESIPDDCDVIEIGDDLLLCSKGTVWTKSESFFGGEHQLLGYATVKPGVDPTLLKP